MGLEAEAAHRQEIFRPYQVNAKLFGCAKPEAIFLHCLPAHRGDEVTDEVIDSPRSFVFQQAENRLHAQKAIMLELMTDAAVETVQHEVVSATRCWSWCGKLSVPGWRIEGQRRCSPASLAVSGPPPA